jgi:aspartate-semialdehyde dehydrogenase
VLVRSPLVEGGARPDISTIAEISAHPAAIMLALATAKLRASGLIRMAATVLQPASELGNAGVEEVHQQTVGLLSFKPLKKDIYDAQVAFNVVASLGAAAKLNLENSRDKIHREIGILDGEGVGNSVTLQLLQAPVFHGYTASVFVEMSQVLDEERVRTALLGDASQLLEEESPSNEMVAGKGEVLVRVTAISAKEGSAFWLWMAADNLRLAARNAAACALELVQLKPMSGVQ